MSDIKVLKVNAQGHYQEHDEAADSIKVSSLKTANNELTDAKLGALVSGGDASTYHDHSSIYFGKTEFIDESAGVADAGKPVKADAAGKIDQTFIDVAGLNSSLDHGALAGLGDDDHTIYTKADGTRAFSGAQSMGDFKLTNLADPSAAKDAVNLRTMQSYLEGLKPKAAVSAATVADVAIATALEAADVLDGVTLTAGMRVLVKDQTDASENGIYIVQASGAAVRATDFDSITPIDEINGAYVPVSNGTANAGKFFVQTGTAVVVVGTDDINFAFFNSASTLSAGNGIDYSGSIVSAKLLASGGLKISGTSIAVEPSDFSGEGLVDDGSDNLAIDWSTAYNDSKAIKASDLSSVSSGKGASIIGVQDANSYFTSTNQEGVNNELFDKIEAGAFPLYTSGSAITKGDLVYISAAGVVSIYSTLSNNDEVVGIALETVLTASPVKVAHIDFVLIGVLSGATAGARYYWDGSAFSTSMSTTSGANVWTVGVAKNATDLIIKIAHVRKNA